MTSCYWGKEEDTAEMMEDGTEVETEAPHTRDSKLSV